MDFPIEEIVNDPNYFQNTYMPINSFISDLQAYEDCELSEQSIQIELKTLKKIHQMNSSKGSINKRNRDTESKILFAYVSIFCGCLLAMIPTPITATAGASLVSGGLYVLCEDRWVQTDLDNYEKERKRKYDM